MIFFVLKTIATVESV